MIVRQKEKGKKEERDPRNQAKKNLKRNPRNPRRNIHILAGCGDLNPRVQKKKSAKSLRALAKGKTKGKPISILGLIS